MTENEKVILDENSLENRLSKLRAQELKRIKKGVEIEKDWWSDKTIEDPNSTLLANLPDEFDSFRLIFLLRNGNEPRSVRKEILDLLGEINNRWREKMKEKGIPYQDVLLSITSAYRTRELQDKLANNSQLAAKGFSAHLAGAAIDFDPKGYYVRTEDKIKPINPRSESYDPRYTETLKEVLLKLQEESLSHVIIEYGFRINDNNEIEKYEACYHVAVSPNYTPEKQLGN